MKIKLITRERERERERERTYNVVFRRVRVAIVVEEKQ